MEDAGDQTQQLLLGILVVRERVGLLGAAQDQRTPGFIDRRAAERLEGRHAGPAMERAEQVSVQGLRGEADTRAVVDAVMSAEQSLQSAIAIRDKIVSAYLEISRMAI